MFFKKLSLTGLILVAVLGPIIAIKVLQIGSLIAMGKTMEANGMPPVAVATYVASAQEWEQTLQSVGSLQAVQGAMLTSEVGGRLVEVAVENGAAVEKDQVLFRFDSTVEEAQLQASLASQKRAELELERARSLLAANTISQAEFDLAEADARSVIAQTEGIRAQIAKKVVRAPFSGRVGIRQVNLGQTIAPSSGGAGGALIAIYDLDPIFVDFSLPQGNIGTIATGQTIRVKLSGLDQAFEGKITAINPEVDSSTRNIGVQGTLANPDERLRPGMFVDVTVVQPSKRAVVAVPATAIIHAPFGDSVYVVEEKDGKTIARQQFVRLGGAQGDFVAVVDGLAAGARIVSAGAFKLTNNSPVTIDDSMQPEASLAPQPKNS